MEHYEDNNRTFQFDGPAVFFSEMELADEEMNQMRDEVQAEAERQQDCGNAAYLWKLVVFLL